MDGAPQFVGVSAASRAIDVQVDLAARSDAKVLITGESGVGKEVVARLIHHRSRRRQAGLVTVNCAGIPDTLLASELFGHVRGSFTDAYRDKQGWIEQAHGGTIFLDEIGEMSAQMQALLLRFLENGEIQRVGSDRRMTSVDARVITATNRRLHERVAAREFREDLFYRLNVLHIEIPPLRQRREDVPVLLAHFFPQLSATHGVQMPHLTDDAAAQLEAYDWPGNVRQLRNVVEGLVVRSRTRMITRTDLPPEILSFGQAARVSSGDPKVRSTAEGLFDRMAQEGAPFWTVVYEPFLAHDITRDDVRALVRRTLELTRGNYKSLAQVFNLPPDDYKRLLGFLRKHQCHLPFQDFRTQPVQVAPADRLERAALQ